jgi:hypothetical protein
LVAPIEFTMRLDDYAALGGHLDAVLRANDLSAGDGSRAVGWRAVGWRPDNPWPLARDRFPWSRKE